MFDNRPTTAYPDIEPHGTPGFSIRHADNVVLKHCSLTWGEKRPDYFTHASRSRERDRVELHRVRRRSGASGAGRGHLDSLKPGIDESVHGRLAVHRFLNLYLQCFQRSLPELAPAIFLFTNSEVWRVVY